MESFHLNRTETPFTMDVATLYSLRHAPRDSLSQSIQDIISRLKISFKPAYRRPPIKHRVQPEDWRANVLADVHRKVREKDDPDYDEVNAFINKLTKQTYTKMIASILEKLEKRDAMFRLRVTTLLFDRGICQTFYASLMADAYADIAKIHPDALQDLLTQVAMFDTLYATTNVTIVPLHTDPGYNDAIIAWTKQKEKKRAFAVYAAELHSRSLLPESVMATFVQTVADDLMESIRQPKSAPTEEHVDALVRFMFAVAAKVPVAKERAKQVLGIPKAETPCLNMKSRFKLDDSLKL
jgi:hypothetical protein